MSKVKFLTNVFSVIVLTFLFVFGGIFVGVQVGVIDMEPEPEIHGPENTTGVPEVTASEHPRVDGEELEIALYEEVNDRRDSTGEARLVHSERVRLVARVHSKDMADRDFFDHENPDGQGSRERHAEFDACDSTNENIAKFGYIPSNETEVIAEEIVDGWEDSSRHYSIMMSSKPHVTGVGIHVTSDGIIYATQNFCWEHPNA